ncbi:MAG: lysophospholipid acyltransferase family protein [Clostridia bacterium]|nr:lysophospholipid acyltransferase family protein [Clostridia bacterium]MDD4145624.1 lysophospholipid acyltransferase family protein [Clostridia bacterium]
MFYKVLRNLLVIYLTIFNHWKIKGKENIPPEGSVVLISNHVSLWDPVVFACSVNRTVHFMAKEELFKIPIVGKLISALYAFPIKRGQPDRNALRIATKLLQNGEVLGLFPEGTRSKTGKLLPFHPGAALFALRAGTPIIPMCLRGTKTTFPLTFRGRIEVIIGKPLSYEDLYHKKVSSEDLERVTSDIMDEMRCLMEGVQDY